MLIKNPAVFRVSLAVLGIWLISAIALLIQGKHLGDLAFAYVAVWPVNALAAQFKVTPSKPAFTWTGAAPIHSDHWGRS